ncbi:hypothetical protein, partial [Mesorhizobium sp.]|uniref:hypothetical protein n=1 Tax=Mesorhizobium sp. TaxID=1871066 RepID=UPI0025D7C2CD
CRARQGSLQAVRIGRRQGEVISPDCLYKGYLARRMNPVAHARPGFFMPGRNRPSLAAFTIEKFAEVCPPSHIVS